MDPSLDLLPNALFSPSKAAQQRAQAQDWHQVDAWLSTKYQGRSVPQFERNEDTLKALLALAAANDRADEERDLLWAVQKDALAELKCATTSPLVGAIVNGLDEKGRIGLDALASVATVLDAEANGFSVGGKLSQRTQVAQVLGQQLLVLTQLQKGLEKELTALRGQLGELRSSAFQAPVALQRQTLDWNRNTKALRAKLNEYQDRLGGLSGTDSERHGRGVVQKERSLVQLEDRLDEVKAQVEAYKGLPTDREKAMQMVREAEEECNNLSRRLDDLFEGLVEKG